MSVPPDFMARLMAGLQAGMNNPLLTTGIGMMGAAGPSKMPVSLGEALSGGLQQGQALQGGNLQNQMQQLQLRQALLGQQYFQGLLGGDNSQQPNQAQSNQAQIQQITQSQQPNSLSQAPSMPASLDSSISGAPQNPLLSVGGNPQQATAQTKQTAQPNATPQKPQLPALMDPEQDPTYQNLLHRATLAEYFKVGSGAPMLADAATRKDALMAQTVTLTPDQAQLLIPGGTVPGQSIQYHPYSGKWEIAGTEALKPTSVFNASLGTMTPAIQDVRSGKVISGNVPDLSPNKPLPPVLESKAQAIYNGTAPPVAENRGDPAADATMARVRYLAQQNGDTYDASTWQQKQQAVKSFGSGKLGQQTASANKAVLHLDTLEQLADNLNNTQAPAFNHLANAWKQQTGQSAPTSFEAARQIALDEVNKFIIGAGGGVSDREKMQSIISKASSPQQLSDGIKTIKELMAGQLYALQKQYEASTGLHDFQKRYLFPQTQELLQTIQSPEASAAPSGQGWSITKVP